MFRFASPYFFLLLAVFPVAVWFYRRYEMHPAMRVSALPGTDNPGSPVLNLRWGVSFLKITALVCMIFAMARPQWGTQKVNVLTRGINIVLAVDLSKSMEALDFKLQGKVVNRLDAVRDVVRRFIGKRNGDRIGLVVFGSEAYTQVPLTRDYTTIASILERLKIGAAGPQTAIGDAIGISLKRLEDIPSKSNIIILLTDGESNTGELTPEAAAGIALEQKVKIYTVGVGTRGKAPFLINHPLLGEQYVYRDVTFDEPTLKQIAKKTNGLYFRAENTDELEKIYDTIDRLEKTEVKVKTYAEYRELYPWFLIPAFAMLALWVILTNTRYLRIP